MGPLTQPHIWAASKGAGGPSAQRCFARIQGQTRSLSIATFAKKGVGRTHCGVLSGVSSSKVGELTQVAKPLWVFAASSEDWDYGTSLS